MRAVRQHSAQAPTGIGSRTNPATVVQKMENSVHDLGASPAGQGSSAYTATPAEIAATARQSFRPPRPPGVAAVEGCAGRGGRWLREDEGIAATHGRTSCCGTVGCGTIRAARGTVVAVVVVRGVVTGATVSSRRGTDKTALDVTASEGRADSLKCVVLSTEGDGAGGGAVAAALLRSSSSIACTIMPSGRLSWRISRSRLVEVVVGENDVAAISAPAAPEASIVGAPPLLGQALRVAEAVDDDVDGDAAAGGAVPGFGADGAVPASPSVRPAGPSECLAKRPLLTRVRRRALPSRRRGEPLLPRTAGPGLVHGCMCHDAPAAVKAVAERRRDAGRPVWWWWRRACLACTEEGEAGWALPVVTPERVLGREVVVIVLMGATCEVKRAYGFHHSAPGDNDATCHSRLANINSPVSFG